MAPLVWLRLATSLLVLMAVGAACGFLLAVVGPRGLLDRPPQAFLVAHRVAWLTGAMRIITNLGAIETLIPLTLAAGLAWRWLRGTWRPMALLTAALAGAWLLQITVKQIVERSRPPSGVALWHSGGFAFPSGHATTAAAVYGMLAALLLGASRTGLTRFAVVAAGAVLAIGVGVSRMYLGVHWLTDVLAGLAFGTAWTRCLLTATRATPRSPGSHAAHTTVTRP
jgi:membrane-associated phospholipid phosphatase